MARIETRGELLTELRTIAESPRKAKQALDRAVGLAGLIGIERLGEHDLLLLCEALASEGGEVQRWAEALASETLQDLDSLGDSSGDPTRLDAA